LRPSFWPRRSPQDHKVIKGMTAVQEAKHHSSLRRAG
jgi:hypothetical protein